MKQLYWWLLIATRSPGSHLFAIWRMDAENLAICCGNRDSPLPRLRTDNAGRPSGRLKIERSLNSDCLEELRIEDQLQLAGLVRVLLRDAGWPTGIGQCADRSFPEVAVP